MFLQTDNSSRPFAPHPLRLHSFSQEVESLGAALPFCTGGEQVATAAEITEQQQITRAAVSAIADQEAPTLDDTSELEVKAIRVDGRVVQVMGHVWAWKWGSFGNKVKERKRPVDVYTVRLDDDDADLSDSDAWAEVIRPRMARQAGVDRVTLTPNYRLWIDGVEIPV